MKNEIKILSPAKINLFLHVTGKRADGYHDLATLMCCIGLYDTLRLDFNARETTVTCSHPDVPEDATNLVCRAADLFYGQYDPPKEVPPAGLKITIDKQIPVAAGLGGGSSNAAAVLTALNRYYNMPFTKDKLMAMGLSIGADVPFFIFQKPALATGVGERLENYHGLKPFHILLIYPGFKVSTAHVYKSLNLGLTKPKKTHKQRHLRIKNFDIKHHLFNDLETVTASSYPDVVAAKKELIRFGATGALMSGSGPTVFGLFSDHDKAMSAKRFLSQNSKWKLFLADMLL